MSTALEQFHRENQGPDLKDAPHDLECVRPDREVQHPHLGEQEATEDGGETDARTQDVDPARETQCLDTQSMSPNSAASG